jgi:hypothetical protein
MTCARKTLVSLNDTPYYHVVARCVRRAWLWGVDEYAGRDYSHSASRRTFVAVVLVRTESRSGKPRSRETAPSSGKGCSTSEAVSRYCPGIVILRSNANHWGLVARATSDGLLYSYP